MVSCGRCAGRAGSRDLTSQRGVPGAGCGAGGAPRASRDGVVSESVAKASRGETGRGQKRGISTFLFQCSDSVRAFATDLDKRRRREPLRGRRSRRSPRPPGRPAPTPGRRDVHFALRRAPPTAPVESDMRISTSTGPTRSHRSGRPRPHLADHRLAVSALREPRRTRPRRHPRTDPRPRTALPSEKCSLSPSHQEGPRTGQDRRDGAEESGAKRGVRLLCAPSPPRAHPPRTVAPILVPEPSVLVRKAHCDRSFPVPS